MNNDLLNIGTIIRIGQSKLMIIAYLPRDNERISLYAAVPFPTGIMSDNSLIYIDESIDFDIISDGYSDDETRLFKQQIIDIVNELATEVSYEE